MSAPASPAVPRPPELHYQPLPIVLSAVAAGILVDRFRPLPAGVWWATAAIALLLWALATLAVRVRGREHRLAAGLAALLTSALLLAAVAAAAATWHHCRWHLVACRDLGLYAHGRPQPVCIEAIAVQSPRTLPAGGMDALRPVAPQPASRLTLDLVALRNGTDWQPLVGRAVLLVPGEPPKIAAGDRLRCFAHLCGARRPTQPRDHRRGRRPAGRRHLLPALGQRPRVRVGGPAGRQLSAGHRLRWRAGRRQSAPGRLSEPRLRGNGQGGPAGRARASGRWVDGGLHGRRRHPFAGDCRPAHRHFGRRRVVAGAADAPFARLGAPRWSRPPPWPTCCWSTPGLQSCGQRFWCW